MGSRPGFLLIAHRFPPYARVGAYRWTRLASRLARLGHPVHVLTVHWPKMGWMDWFEEVETPGLTVHRISSGYPHRLKYGEYESKTLDRTLGRAQRAFARKFPAYDETSRWGRSLIPEAIRLIDREQLGAIVATGGPFTTNHWAAQLKANRPNVALIQDFRDPWFLSLTEAEQAGWSQQYQQSLNSADAVVGVTPEMTELLASHGSESGRFETISNGVDLATLRNLKAQDDSSPPEVDFIHAGSVFSDRHVPLLPFFDWIRKRNQNGASLKVQLVGRVDRRLPGMCRDLVQSGTLQLLDSMPQTAVFERVLHSRFALHLNAPQTNDTQVSTKLLEYAALGKPTVSLNYGGAADTLVRANRLGWSLNPTSSSFETQLDDVLSSTAPFEPDLEAFDFDSIAARYSALLSQLSS